MHVVSGLGAGGRAKGAAGGRGPRLGVELGAGPGLWLRGGPGPGPGSARAMVGRARAVVSII